MKHSFSVYYDKHILVTGGAGFIGSHIAEKLVSLGAHVTVLDDLSTGSVTNIRGFASKIEFISGDITSFKTCRKATKNKDAVFHCAALVSVPESVSCPSLCEKINVRGTENMLEACKKNGVPHFVLSSSAAIYGNKNVACYEDDVPNPQSPYATSKLEGEKLCKLYAVEDGISTACLRYFNVYGDRQNPNGNYAAVVSKFTHHLTHELPIVIYGNGRQKRDFIHVSHVVDANLTVGMQTRLHGDVFNVATGTSITVLDMLKKLERDLNMKRTGIMFRPTRPGDVFYSEANCEKYREFQSTHSG